MAYVAVGKVIGPYGQEGWVRVEPLTDFPERFNELERLFVSRDMTDDFPLPLKLEKVEYASGRLVLACKGIDDGVSAQALTGSYLLIPEAERYPLPEDRYYIDDLTGLRVIRPDDTEVGQVVEVLPNPGNDLLVIRTAQGREFLLPMVKAFIHKVDKGKKVISVSIPPGLEEL